MVRRLYSSQISNFKKVLNDWIEYMQLSQELVDELYDDINFINEQFNSVINHELLDSDEWDGQEFKSSFIEENIWAIANGAPEIRKQFRGRVNGDKLIVGIVEMISLAEEDRNIDEVLKPALVPLISMPNKISIASEILHKCMPDVYPIKNYKSNWGLALIIEPEGLVNYVRALSYEEFRDYLDLLYEVMEEELLGYDIDLNEYYKYWMVDRVFWYMVDEKYSEVIKMYNTRDKKYY